MAENESLDIDPLAQPSMAPAEELPVLVEAALFGDPRVCERGLEPPWIRLLLRYRQEWLAILDDLGAKGAAWAKWLNRRDAA